MKVLPHSMEAEKALIGSLFLDDSKFNEVCEILDIQDFYHLPHQLIFNSMKYQNERKKPIDPILICEILRESQSLNECGGESYIFLLATETPNPRNVIAYSQVVRERSVLREIIKISSMIQIKCLKNENIIDVIDYSQKKMEQLAYDMGFSPRSQLDGLLKKAANEGISDEEKKEVLLLINQLRREGK